MLAAHAANQLLVPAAAATSSDADGSWLYDLLWSGISDAHCIETGHWIKIEISPLCHRGKRLCFFSSCLIIDTIIAKHQ